MEGSRDDRAQFQEMLSLARQDVRHVDGIVLWSFSRFARDQLDAQLYKAKLRKLGYVVLSKSDDIPANELVPVYESSSTGRINVSLMISRSTYGVTSATLSIRGFGPVDARQ